MTFSWEGWLLRGQAAGHRTPILGSPKPLWHVSIPVAGIARLGDTLRRAIRVIRPSRAPRE